VDASAIKVRASIPFGVDVDVSVIRRQPLPEPRFPGCWDTSHKEALIAHTFPG
jgi:hypothetical protein